MKRTTLALLAALCACTAQQQSEVRQSALVAAVGTKLAAIDPDSTTAVRISAHNGVVTLRGEARSADERARYVTAAKSVSGVVSVVDDLRINPHLRGVSETLNDAALAARISGAIAAQTGVNAFSVTPQVHDGTVTLNGTASSPLVEETILKTVSNVPGVRRVVNHIRVK